MTADLASQAATAMSTMDHHQSKDNDDTMRSEQRHAKRRRFCIDRHRSRPCVQPRDDSSGKVCGLCDRCHCDWDIAHTYVSKSQFEASRKATMRLVQNQLEDRVLSLEREINRMRDKQTRERFTYGLRPADIV